MDDNEQMLIGLEQASNLIALAAGYRARCRDAGFNESAAEVMAVDFHRVLLLLNSHTTTEAP